MLYKPWAKTHQNPDGGIGEIVVDVRSELSIAQSGVMAWI